MNSAVVSISDPAPLWKLWVQGARPKTLTAAVSPILVGTMLAKFETGRGSWAIALLALLASLLIQIGTNFFNDAIDFKKGTDRAERIGPTRLAGSGLVSADRVLRWAWGAFALAFLLGCVLVKFGGWPILAIGVAGLACGYLYTGGPFPLAYLGLGDLFVILFFGFAAVGGTYWLQCGEISVAAIAKGLEIGMLATVLIAINNLRDARQDVVTGKRTLPVRFGENFGRWEIAVLAIGPFFLSLAFDPKLYLPIIVGVPLAWNLIRRVFATPPGPAYNRFLGKAALLHLVYGITVAVELALRLVWARWA